MTTPYVRVTLALLGTAAVFSGCGGEPSAVTDTDAVVRVKLSEYRITPQNVKVVATTTPMRVRIVATNVGKLTHTVKVERDEDQSDVPDDSVAVEPTNPVLCGSPTGNAAPGEVIRSGDIMLAPGEYRLVDTIGNHENLGQYGTLTVEVPSGKVLPRSARPSTTTEGKPCDPAK